MSRLRCEVRIRKNKIKDENYLLLRENESITILADSEIKSSINIVCKNKKLYVQFLNEPPKEKTRQKKK